MCNFCNLKETAWGVIGEEYQSYRYAPSICIKSEKSDFYLVSMGEDETFMPIHYCPKCGRKL